MSTTEKTITFQLKGGLYPLTALQMLHSDLSNFEHQLQSKIGQAPKFFHQAPIVIDLQKVNQQPFDFKALTKILSDNSLRPVGVKGGTPEQHALALSAGLPILHEGGKELIKPKESKLETKPIAGSTSVSKPLDEKEIHGTNTKIITEPVRSGQQIYVRGGDLVVLAPVSHGSELLADGHIHVYGPLRGRALAGVTGDEGAYVFCQSLEAELISIAGQYKISEDIDQELWKRSVKVSLRKGHLHIESF